MIVGSILLAFSIDAAWDGRAEGQRRDAMLAALGSDMALAKGEIDRVFGHNLIGRDAAEDLLNLEGAPLADDSQRFAVDSLVSALWSGMASYDAPMGAVASLVNSGDLDLLDDPLLASYLTAFPALVANLEREQQVLQTTAFDLNAYLGSEGVDISQLTIGEEVSWKVTTTEVFTLVGSPRFRGIATEIYFRYRNAMSILDSMRQMIVQVESRLAHS